MTAHERYLQQTAGFPATPLTAYAGRRIRTKGTLTFKRDGPVPENTRGTIYKVWMGEFHIQLDERVNGIGYVRLTYRDFAFTEDDLPTPEQCLGGWRFPWTHGKARSDHYWRPGEAFSACGGYFLAERLRDETPSPAPNRYRHLCKQCLKHYHQDQQNDGKEENRVPGL